MTNCYSNINEVYLDAIKYIRNNGLIVNSVSDDRSVGSFFGNGERPYKEVLGYSFVLDNPRSRIVTSYHRKASLGFAIANSLWVLNARSDVKSISFYNKLGKAFSDNGKYYESAFGKRIFTDYNSWNYAKALLQSDTNTRRALIPIFLPKDLIDRPFDTPCASYIHLLIRDNKLDMILSMRSQSVIMVFPYDLFLFTILQEFFTLQLNVELGKLHYYCDSFHYYLNEEELGGSIVNEQTGCNHNNSIMPHMTNLSDLQIKKIKYTERKIRDCIFKDKGFPYSSLEGIDDYWRELLYVLWIKGCQEHKKKSDLQTMFKHAYLNNNKI
ncbi:MAG: hypothetical protein FE834_03915 [Gammaproteobacteria bacterium]|nr:hypothetical protein [Gammaproteobacteria bacterium]